MPMFTHTYVCQSLDVIDTLCSGLEYLNVGFLKVKMLKIAKPRLGPLSLTPSFLHHQSGVLG